MKYDPKTGKTTEFRNPSGRANGLDFDAAGPPRRLRRRQQPAATAASRSAGPEPGYKKKNGVFAMCTAGSSATTSRNVLLVVEIADSSEREDL